MTDTAALRPARLTRRADGTPFSASYDDVYHSAAGGPGQARHVFLAGNGLPERWRGRTRFVVVETGFGCGLNFLATWQAWRNDRERCQRLHYVSFEKHPFTAADLASLHAAWPELASLAGELRRRWPVLVGGLHRLYLDEERVVLDLVLGDATHCLPQLVARADAFYLDGFAPAKNPELWDAALLAALSARAAPGATLATWSVAGSVRSALAANGWQLAKRPGFAAKREMLCGSFSPPSQAPQAPFAPAATSGGEEAASPGSGGSAAGRRIIVLGAGLAGSTAANRLAARGWQVTVVDAAEAAGCGASGNRAGVLRPLPARGDNSLARITRAAFLTTCRHLQMLADAGAAEAGELWGRTGVLHLARDATHEAAQREVVAAQQPPADYLRFVERDEAAAICGWPVAAGGWWFPGGAWVAPAVYCRANLRQQAANIATRFSTPVARIAHEDGLWHCYAADGGCLAAAPQLVIANAADARRLLGDWLPVFAARGQVSHLPAAPASPPRCVVCRLGYVTPEIAGERYAGATFLMRDADPALRETDHAENLARLEFMLPGYTAADAAGACAGFAGRVGFRPTSPDRLPLVGAVPRLGETAAPPGLWLVDGFGARGIVWSALAGELIADLIDGAPNVLGRDLAAALAPARFLERPRRARPPAAK